MTNLNIDYIIRLIEASEILKDVQKRVLKKKLSKFSTVDFVELQMLLEREQEINKAYYDKLIEIRRRYNEKRAKTIQRYDEKVRQDNEQNVLDNLEASLKELNR